MLVMKYQSIQAKIMENIGISQSVAVYRLYMDDIDQIIICLKNTKI